MRLIITERIASIEELKPIAGLGSAPLDVVVAQNSKGVESLVVKGELNIVLTTIGDDPDSLRQLLSNSPVDERPIVLVVDVCQGLPNSGSRNRHSQHPESGSAGRESRELPVAEPSMTNGFIDLPANAMDWSEAGAWSATAGISTRSAGEPADSMSVGDWLDSLLKPSGAAVLGLQHGRIRILDPDLAAKLGFEHRLKAGQRVGHGFAYEDRRALLEWLTRTNSNHPGVSLRRDPITLGMRAEQGIRSVELQSVPTTGETATTTVLISSSPLASQDGTMPGTSGLARDSETGLYGPTEFQEAVRISMGQVRGSEQSCAVLVCRLDGLEEIERILGAEAKSVAYQTASIRLRRAGGEVESMSRLGPHEFGFVFVSTDPRSVIEQQILRFQRAIQPPLTGGEKPMSATLRFGVCEAYGQISRPRAVVRLARSRAAAALLLDQPICRNPSTAQKSTQGSDSKYLGLSLEREIERACQEQEFELYLQPVIHLRTFAVKGAEVLVRWRHPVRGLLAPVHFLPMAESTGQISQIGRWMLNAVCSQATQWARLFAHPPRFAVNVSPVELHDHNFLSNTLGILASHTFDSAEIELEITETAVLASEQKTADVVECLRRQGVRVALDDFGVGYSSLAHLREIPFSKLKIDRTFVHGSTSSQRCRTIIRSMVELGKGLHMEVNAEGLETADQLRFLYESGCDEVQGYLFARPMPPNRFESWVAGYQGKTSGGSPEPQSDSSDASVSDQHSAPEQAEYSNVLPFSRHRLH